LAGLFLFAFGGSTSQRLLLSQVVGCGINSISFWLASQYAVHFFAAAAARIFSCCVKTLNAFIALCLSIFLLYISQKSSKISHILFFFFIISFFVFLFLLVAGFSVAGFSVAGFSGVVFSLFHTGFSVMVCGVSNSS